MRHGEATPFYLVLHRVRDEPLFDIAESTTIAGEEAWIVCSSGHRAYPVAWWPLFEIVDEEIEKTYKHAEMLPTWDIVPDHHWRPDRRPTRSPRQPKTLTEINNILGDLTDAEMIEALSAVARSRR